jgi:hypothetical protein
VFSEQFVQGSNRWVLAKGTHALQQRLPHWMQLRGGDIGQVVLIHETLQQFS